MLAAFFVLGLAIAMYIACRVCSEWWFLAGCCVSSFLDTNAMQHSHLAPSSLRTQGCVACVQGYYVTLMLQVEPNVSGSAVPDTFKELAAPRVLAAAAKGPSCWDCTYYLNHNPDLVAEFDSRSCFQAFSHFVNTGQFTARPHRCAHPDATATGAVIGNSARISIHDLQQIDRTETICSS